MVDSASRVASLLCAAGQAYPLPSHLVVITTDSTGKPVDASQQLARRSFARTCSKVGYQVTTADPLIWSAAAV